MGQKPNWTKIRREGLLILIRSRRIFVQWHFGLGLVQKNYWTKFLPVCHPQDFFSSAAWGLRCAHWRVPVAAISRFSDAHWRVPIDAISVVVVGSFLSTHLATRLPRIYASIQSLNLSLAPPTHPATYPVIHSPIHVLTPFCHTRTYPPVYLSTYRFMCL